MPRLTRFSVRLSLAYLGLGFTLGAGMLANEGLGFSPWLWGLLPTHIVILSFGWLVQLAFAVAYWILPRRDGRRGSDLLAVMSVGFINLGVILVGVSPWMPLHADVLQAGYLSLALASIAFALHAWPRLRGPHRSCL